MGTTVTLTKREYEVMHCVAEGRRNKEIALELEITENTVEKHLTNIYMKLNARNRVEAVYRILEKSRESVIG